jgi:lysophospholipase L1-like esterase
VAVIARQLRASRTVTLTNLGVPGAVLGPETQALARRHGRDIPGNFLEHELPFVPRDSTLVTVFAGGNDVNAIALAMEAGAVGGGSASAFVDQQVRQFASDMSRLVRGVRERAADARIVIANLPNLARAPYASPLAADRRQRLRELSVGFSTQGINPLAGQGAVVVDLLCDERTYDRGYFSADGFHPNDAGYAHIASRLMAGITGAPGTPSESCAAMN